LEPDIPQVTVEIYFKCPLCSEENSLITQLPSPHLFLNESNENEDFVIRLRCSECRVEHETKAYCSGYSYEFYFKDHQSNSIAADISNIPYPEDEWFSSGPGVDPFGVFREGCLQIKQLLRISKNTEDGTSLIHRMIFAQYFSVFETYMADTLINNVLSNKACVRKLLAKDEKLSKDKYTLIQIEQIDDFVNNKVRTYLRENIVYHNLNKADFLYNTTLGISIFPSGINRGLLDKAVQHRHDCVHRNGHDQDGKEVTVFNAQYISDVAKSLEDIVSHVQAKIIFAR